ncbi:hypothetical protein AFCA_002599 [Aspergillus flavus]|uniref:Uncharacterized protein n=1 Tax=Aspergillus flavus TaxID=5059 RepID=A0AB74CDZ5_ASPFL|nr:hypothetical protein CA14_009205 [Aspergillus flavus]UDD54955.1 hypothetical protein AFCA_002599 [Aspergillus flavus]
MADVVDNTAAPAPQVAGGGGKPPGKRGNRGRRNPPPDRQQERGGKRKRQEKACRTCGETDHEKEEHFEWTLMNAINALTGARQNRLQAKRAASSPASASNNQVAPAAQEGRQGRKTKRGRRPSLRERRRRRDAQQQQQGAEQSLVLAQRAHRQPHPPREVEQPMALALQALQQPLPHAQHQGCEGPQVLPQRADEPLLFPPVEDEPSDPEDLLVCSRTVRTATFKGNASLRKSQGQRVPVSLDRVSSKELAPQRGAGV